MPSSDVYDVWRGVRKSLSSSKMGGESPRAALEVQSKYLTVKQDGEQGRRLDTIEHQVEGKRLCVRLVGVNLTVRKSELKFCQKNMLEPHVIIRQALKKA